MPCAKCNFPTIHREAIIVAYLHQRCVIARANRQCDRYLVGEQCATVNSEAIIPYGNRAGTINPHSVGKCCRSSITASQCSSVPANRQITRNSGRQSGQGTKGSGQSY